MSQTLLEIVSDILSDMESDYVNSVHDTDEGLAVAQIVRTTYLAMMSNRNWPHTARIINLVPMSNNDLPTHMRVNEDIKEMISVYYNCQRINDPRIDYRQIKYLDPDAFLRFTNRRNSVDVNTRLITDPSGVRFMISANKAPEYFTSFNDTDLVFDSYDAIVDSSLQASKTQARAYVIPEFRLEDTFVPDLPNEAFAALIEESKSKAMYRFKSIQDIKAEQEAGRQQRWLSRKSWKTHEKDIYPYNYGRNGGYRKDTTFRRD